MHYKIATSKGPFEDDCDILIILDACRFDVFSECNPFSGKLQPIKILCNNTIQWLNYFWADHYDFTYVSGNPNINSLGMPKYSEYRQVQCAHCQNWLRFPTNTPLFTILTCEKCKQPMKLINKVYTANKHFTRIIDVWDNGWSEELGTTLPEPITEAALKHLNDDLLIHYMQPHSPFIGEPKLDLPVYAHVPAVAPLHIVRKKVMGEVTIDEKGRSTQPSEKRSDNSPRLLPLAPLHAAYRGNLKRVLNAIKPLIEIAKDKRVVITSDHSELLGEHNLIGHGYHENLEIPIPYLIVES